MKKLLVICTGCGMLFGSLAFSQNVGIGNPSPNEKLDVSGNINVTGTIKANGIDGTAGQVLMKNGAGNLAWGDPTEFKNHITFAALVSSNWTVPAGVTRIRVEAWGGGGGASSSGISGAGGGGGGYVTAIFNVTPGGLVSYSVGGGGVANFPSGQSGFNSSVTYSTFSVTAMGGQGDNSSSTNDLPTGGSFSGSTGLGFYGCVGEPGSPSIFGGFAKSATVWMETMAGGKGGDGGNTINTGGKGSYLMREVGGATLYGVFGTHGGIPGGGGATSGIWGGSNKNGAQGLVIIHY